MRSTGIPRSSAAFDWLMAILSAALIAGVVQDGWAHNHGKVDQSFFTPWHAMLYSAMALSGIVLAVVGVRNLLRGYRFIDGLPFGYWLSAIGVFLFAFGGGLDLAWHTLFGIEMDIDALVSPTHLILALAAAFDCSGPLRSVAHRVGTDGGGWRDVGPAVVAATAMLVLVGFFTQYVQPIGDDGIAAVVAKTDDEKPAYQLYEMDADGSRQLRLLPEVDGDLFGPSASPDGKSFAFRVEAEGQTASNIEIASVDGGGPLRLTDSGRHDTMPAWSPHGRSIAYVSEPAGTSGDFELRTVGIDGKPGPTLLAGVTTIAYPTWSPDAQSIAIASRNGLDDEIEVVDVRTRATRWLAATENGTEPAWSPDGNAIAFVEEDTAGGNDSAVALAGLGGGPPRVIATGDASQPAWSPDGARIAYVKDVGSDAQVFLANADGTGAVDASRFSGLDAARIAWTPSGRLIVAAIGRALPRTSDYALALSLSGMLLQAIVLIGCMVVLVRRWRIPAGSITLVFALFSIAMASQNDDWFAVPAATVAGAVADALIAWQRERARGGVWLWAIAAATPAVLTAGYLVALDVTRGLGWPPNMIAGSPAIAAVAGLFVGFIADPPLAGSPRRT